MQTYATKGGIELSAAKVASSPGTLQDCQNYEIAYVDGYSRIEGFDRFDGQYRVPDTTAVRLHGTLASGTFLMGDAVQVSGVPGYVTDVGEGSPWNIAVLYHASYTLPRALPISVVNVSRDGLALVTSMDDLAGPVGSQSIINTSRKALADAKRPMVGPVPGDPNSPVAGVFWFKNRLYAIRDYPVVWFESSTPSPFTVGSILSVPGGNYQAIVVQYSASDRLAGYVVLWPVDTGGLPMRAAPSPGDIITQPSSYTGADTSGAALGELPMGMEGTLRFGSGLGTVTGSKQAILPASDDLVVRAYQTPAGLWKATASGWQSVDLNREAQFSGGGTDFSTFIDANIGTSTPATLGPVACTNASITDTSDVTYQISAEDGIDSQLADIPVNVLLATGFPMSDIPDTATILGITVTLKRHADVGGKVVDGVMELIGLDGTTTNKALSVEWPTANTVITYGGPTDTWGNNNITPTSLKSSGFGVHLTANSVDAIPSGGIDYLAVSVTYRRRDASVFAWSGTLDVPVSLIDVQPITGAYADGDVTGWLVLDVPGSGFASQLGNGYELRTAAAGGGTKLATITSSDLPIRLPGWPDLKANKSRYQFLMTNFKGQAEYESMYGVSGASPAFTYDGTRWLWVRTTIAPAQDLPRHIARHGGTLVLGYQPGAYVLSAVGQPTNFNGVDGAASFEIGQPLTGMLEAIGDVLLVMGTKTTRVLHGLTSADYTEQTISDSRGSIEYTAADVGRLLFTDSFAVAAADATQVYGNLARVDLSDAVQQWLSARMKTTAQQPITSIAALRKNQYRLYFPDGVVMTMTLGKSPGFTFQRYFLPATDGADDQGFPLACVCSGVDLEGRERLFGSFDADANRGYVMELDHGNTFDGRPIYSYLTFNPLAFGGGVTLKRFDRMFLLGQAEGYAELNLSRDVNYDVPDGSNPFALTLGNDEVVVTRARLSAMVAARGEADAAIEGYDVSVRIDSITDSEGPHILQAIATDADAEGDSRGHVRG